MRIFVYEFGCAGGFVTGSGSESLGVEGEAMLSAVLKDFCEIPKAEVSTLLAPRLKSPRFCSLANLKVHTASTSDEREAFRRLAWEADFSLVIAPEFDEILYQRCRWVEEVGGRLLGPGSAAVRITADKLALGELMRERGVRTPTCARADSAWTIPFPAVCKPRHGAGSQATILARTPDEVFLHLEAAASEGWKGQMIVQSFVPGQACSAAFLVGPTKVHALPPASQHLSSDGRFRYLGGSLPLAALLAERASKLGLQAVRAVEGLKGYVGVDLVLGEAEDGDQVIEVNPRLTTSYVGLRALAKGNLAEAMLRVVMGNEVAALEWHSAGLDFRPNGSVLPWIDTSIRTHHKGTEDTKKIPSRKP